MYLCLCIVCVCIVCVCVSVFVSNLRGVEEHLVMHLHLPEQAGDVCVGQGHEHHVVNPKQRHQHQGGLQQLPAGGGHVQQQLPLFTLQQVLHVGPLSRERLQPWNCLTLHFLLDSQMCVCASTSPVLLSRVQGFSVCVRVPRLYFCLGAGSSE